MGQILNQLAPYTQLLVIIGMFWYATTQYSIDRARRRWKAKFRQECARRESAEAANKAKALFLTNMSHEIRAPLNAIDGFTELALKSPLNPELRQYLGTVRVSSEWLGHIIKEILDFSRMEAGTLHLCIGSFSLKDIVRSAIKIAQPLADEKKLALRFQLDACIPPLVQGDSARLLQVLFNLIENALKFTSSGSVLVIATVLHSQTDSVTVRVSVADTGMGIPPDQVAHLFEPLATIVSAAPVDRRTRTCGFGLPICHRIVQMMGGHIDVLSRAGIGSTFSFTLELPVVIEETNGPNPAAQPLAKRSIQILIADSKVQGRLATVLLQGAGHIVTEAATGVEALNRFTEGCFDLVLLDVEMPDLSCTEATKAIRATEPPGRRTPIYALAAASPEAEKERWFQAGMTGFLERPLSPELLLQLASAIGVVKENSSKPMDHHVDLPDETPVATSVGYRET